MSLYEAPLSARLLSAPNEPMKVAREIAPDYPVPLRWWRGHYYGHCGTHWVLIEDDVIRRWVYRITERANYAGKNAKGEDAIKQWSPNRTKVADVLDALSRGLTQHEEDEVRCMALANGVLDPITRKLADHDPGRFNLSALPFEYDPAAECPEWLAFLESSLPGDRQAHEFLGEWFGYVLSGRTDLHKIGVLVGPPRCGKGTISRVLEAMVGRDGWAAPTLAKFSGTFGMEPLLGKSLAVMGDIRWTSKYVIDAVPILLGISGEDGFSVARKNRDDVTGRLGVRLMLMSNDAPVFTDASGALAGRMVYTAFHRSFLGQEDLELQGRLMKELPGILNWALDGLDRLNSQGGYFTQSMNSLELKEDVDRDSSPVTAWVDDRCVLDPTAEVTLEALMQSYRSWLTAENMQFAPSLSRLSRDIGSAFRDKGVTIERKRDKSGGKHRVVTGIRVLVGSSIPTDALFDNAE